MHLRFRREDAEVADNKLRCGPTHPKKQNLCCAGDKMEDWHAEEKDTKMQCYKEVTGKDSPDPPAKKHSLVDPLNCEELNKKKEQMRVRITIFYLKLKILLIEEKAQDT